VQKNLKMPSNYAYLKYNNGRMAHYSNHGVLLIATNMTGAMDNAWRAGV